MPFAIAGGFELLGIELAQFIHAALSAEQPCLRDFHGLLLLSGLPEEVREVVIIGVAG